MALNLQSYSEVNKQFGRYGVFFIILIYDFVIFLVGKLLQHHKDFLNVLNHFALQSYLLKGDQKLCPLSVFLS